MSLTIVNWRNNFTKSAKKRNWRRKTSHTNFPPLLHKLKMYHFEWFIHEWTSSWRAAKRCFTAFNWKFESWLEIDWKQFNKNEPVFANGFLFGTYQEIALILPKRSQAKSSGPIHAEMCRMNADSRTGLRKSLNVVGGGSAYSDHRSTRSHLNGHLNLEKVSLYARRYSVSGQIRGLGLEAALL